LRSRTYAHGLEEVLGVGIDIELAGLGLGNIQSGDLRNVLILALTLLLLQLERDTADRATLDTLHKVGGVTSDLVAKTLGGNDSDLIAKTLVGLEVERQLGVVTLDDDLGGPLDCLGSNATHFGGCVLAGWMFGRRDLIHSIFLLYWRAWCAETLTMIT
jgi:hypothetical protein